MQLQTGGSLVPVQAVIILVWCSTAGYDNLVLVFYCRLGYLVPVLY